MFVVIIILRWITTFDLESLSVIRLIKVCHNLSDSLIYVKWYENLFVFPYHTHKLSSEKKKESQI